MPGFFTVQFEAQSIANASGDYDLFELDAATDYPCEVLWVELGQSSELGDAADEQLRLSLIRGNTTSGNGTTTTPRSPDGVGSIQCAAETVASTPASAGSPVTLWSSTFKVLTPGPLWTPLPQGSGFRFRGSELMCLRLNAAVADDLTMSGTAFCFEY